MREIRIERPLNATNPIEALFLQLPSLSLRTLGTMVTPGRQTSLILFQGKPSDLDQFERRYVQHPPKEIEAISVLRRSPRRLLVHEVEQSGINPTDISSYVLRILGPETFIQVEKGRSGVVWTLLPLSQDRIGEFLEELGRAPDERGDVRMQARQVSWYRLASISQAGATRPPGDHLEPEELSTIQTALRLGFYEQPKACDVDGLAKALDTPRSTVHYRLKKAERKVIESSRSWLA